MTERDQAYIDKITTDIDIKLATAEDSNEAIQQLRIEIPSKFVKVESFNISQFWDKLTFTIRLRGIDKRFKFDKQLIINPNVV